MFHNRPRKVFSILILLVIFYTGQVSAAPNYNANESERNVTPNSDLTQKFEMIPSLAVSTTYTAISAGQSHTCALTSAGGVRCWGNNYDGKLGNGTTDYSIPVPVDVIGLSSGVSAISAGGSHTCVITSIGGVKCWGSNTYGELGNGMTTKSTVPVNVIGLSSGVTAITAGGYHTCALTNAGGVKCWGDNSNGQLGNGTKSVSTVPANVIGLSSGVSAISAGYGHACAINSASGVKCWGDNDNGQLGNGTYADSTVPVAVNGLSSGITAISAGYGTCALTNLSGVKCWGSNYDYEPVDVSFSNGVASISVSAGYACVLTNTGGVKCWGNNYDGQLGNGTNTDSIVPVNVIGLSGGVAAISAGYGHACAISSAGEVKCWGENWIGQLGNGTTTDSNVPVDLVGILSDISAISAGDKHTCALTNTGGVKCWGESWDGRLGNETDSSSPFPVYVSGLTSGVTAISAGGYITPVH